MNTFVKIYGLIFICGILSALFDRVLLKKSKDSVITCLVYSVGYYIIICLARTIVGNGREQLSYSFYDKGLQGYVKVCLLLAICYIINCVLSYVTKNLFDDIKKQTIGFFAALESLYIVFIGHTYMKAVVIISVISFLFALLYIRFVKDKTEFKNESEYGIYYVVVQYAAFCVQHYISGPSELYAYNSDEFIYDYRTMIIHLIVGAICVSVVLSTLIYKTLSKKASCFVASIMAIYNIVGYIQYFLLNGKMTELDGSTQGWGAIKLSVNTIIWIALIVALVILLVKTKRGLQIITGLSLYVIIVQLAAVGFALVTTNVLDNKSEQIVMDGSLELSKDNNIVIFILDAYDNQEIDMVLADDSDYLNPLKDFTYYNNVSSRYYYTDFSLPYFLTGGNGDLNAETKSEAYEWYNNSKFLPRIVDYGYKINILTEKKYVDKFEPNIEIGNYTAENYCILDTERTIGALSKCIRYRNMPYILKGFYAYSFFDLSDIIVDSNIYKFGRDDLIDDKLNKEGITINDSVGTLDIYHMYGAHAPYYVTEDGRTNYSGSTPLAQFKGCLRLVYDYIDILKRLDLYDKTTIIITSDHGLNPGQVDALKTAGVSCDETKSNPIFFIKRKEETSDNMIIDSKELSHDQIFDTVMNCIDSKWGNRYFGTIWE